MTELLTLKNFDNKLWEGTKSFNKLLKRYRSMTSVL